MKIYTIKKGNHYNSNLNLKITKNKIIEFTAMFSNNCLYHINDNDIYDINKLYGVSTSYYHHKSSARIGWRCLDNKNIELLSYTYDNWKRLESKTLYVVKPNETFICRISINKNEIIYQINNNVLIENITTKPTYFKYYLFPYFGGNKTAPHNMNITIKEK